jgi:lipopolysaccharide transport system ATP-binding protein
MNPKSTIEYPENGARILSPSITTLSGRCVNVLVPHQQYEIRFRALFQQAATHVHFGALLKTTQGINVTAAAYGGRELSHVPAGTEAFVVLRFRCALNPGVYFVNVGVQGHVGGQPAFHHRIIDALMLRVSKRESHLRAGITDLFTHVAVQLNDERDMKAA